MESDDMSSASSSSSSMSDSDDTVIPHQDDSSSVSNNDDIGIGLFPTNGGPDSDNSTKLQKTTDYDDDDRFVPYFTARRLDIATDDTEYYLNDIAKNSKENMSTKKTSIPVNKYKERKHCEQCPYSTDRRHCFRVHMMRHVDAKFKCLDCNMPFLTKGALTGHKKSAHGIDEIVWKQCEKCDYKTKHSSDMARHRRRHVSAIGSCKYCNRPFCHLGRLIEHEKRGYCEKESAIGSTESFSNVRERDNKKAERPTVRNEQYNSWNELNQEQHTTKSKTNLNRAESVHPTTKGNKKKTHQLNQSKKQEKEKNKVKKYKKQKPENRNANKENMRTGITIEEESENEIMDEPNIAGIQMTPYAGHQKKVEESSCARVEVEQRMTCAFCGYKTFSYNDLNKHLDEHDVPEYLDENDISGEDIREEFDNEETDVGDNKNRYLSSHTMASDGVAFPMSRTNNIEENAENENGTYLQNSVTDGISDNQKEGEIANPTDIKSTSEKEFEISETENIDDVNDLTDADDIFNRCVAKIEAESASEFLMKPFACAKCFFKTGSLNYLRIHVEAHLFETARTECHLRQGVHGRIT